MYKFIEVIKELTDNQMKYENVKDLMLNFNEEYGEFSTAVGVEDGTINKVYKQGTLKEDSRQEAIDVVICALSLYFARGGDIKYLFKYGAHKLSKWATAQKKGLLFKKQK
jgi:NTP pyrophosphatase (non-canonical NTP hydrolase)